MQNHINDSYHKQIYALFVLLVFCSPLLYVGILEHPSDLPRYIFFAAVGCLAFLLFLLHLWRTNSEIYFTTTTVLFFVFLVFAGISSVWAEDKGNNLISIIRLLNFFIIFFIASQISNTTTIKSILYISLFAAAISSIIGLLQNFGHNIFGLRGYVMGGTFIFKNHAALYLDLILPVGLCFILLTKRSWLKWLTAVTLAICVVYVRYSHTRGSLVAAATMLVLLLLASILLKDVRLYLRKNSKLFLKPLLFVIIVSAIFSVIPAESDNLVRSKYKGDNIDISTRNRLTVYQNSLALLSDNPVLGVGYGSFRKAFRPYMNHPNIIRNSDNNRYFSRLHSDPLQIFVELGVSGGLLFIALIASVYFIGIKLLIRKCEIEEKILILALMLAISASLVHSLVDFPLLKPSSALQFWIYLGLLVGIYAKDNNIKIYISGTAKFLLSGMFVFFTVAMSAFYYLAIEGGYYLGMAKKSIERRDCQKAMEYIDKSVETFYFNFYSHAHRVNFHSVCNTDLAELYKIINEELIWDDTNIKALLTRGDILLRSGNYALAMQDYQKVKYLIPHRINGHLGEVIVLIYSGEFKEAEPLLDKLEQQYPENPKIHEVRAEWIKLSKKKAGQVQ